ncbi:MAG: hypothetical protein AB7T49_01040 [Oligoflexales bacterium]
MPQEKDWSTGAAYRSEALKNASTGVSRASKLEEVITDLDIELAEPPHPRQEAAKALLEGLCRDYDLRPYFFTKKIRIQHKVMAHSHPVLTLNTLHLDAPPEFLAQFLHEQIHWHLCNRNDQTHSAIRATKAEFPDVPVGLPEGSRTEHSTRLHLIVNYLEWKALASYIGVQEARTIIENKKYYTWIYQTVLARETYVADLIQAYALDIPT